ncbi:MAG: hypothetical protein GX290_03335, partial [Treponema sp.]|nr:hypothetical protein [Treponema sp.]
MNSRRVNETTIQLNAFMRDVKNGNLRTILVNLQKMCDYQSEKLRIYEKHLTELTGKARLELTDSDKRRLAQKGKALNDYLLAAVEPTWAPGTLRGWYNSRLFRVLRKNMVILSRNSAFSWLAPLTAIHKLSVLSTHSHDIR